MTHLLSHGRFTETIREMAAFEGFPSDLPISAIVRGLEYRRGLELEDRRDLAQTLMRLVVAATEGGTFEDVCEHLIHPEVLQKQAQAHREADAMNTSMQTLDFFRGFTERWDMDHSG